MLFRIGMIEDDLAEASSIMLSLDVNSNQLTEESFKLYELQEEPEFREKLFAEIESDIINNQIQCLIVDYKLDTLREVLEGIEIVKYLHDKIPEFPVVILTNVPDKSKSNDMADPDKVYAKEIFMKPDALETKEMVYHIERNLERYTKRRADLELQQEQALNLVIGESKYDEQNYGKLLDIERELIKYVPIEMNGVDEAYDMEDMEKALDALREYKKLLE